MDLSISEQLRQSFCTRMLASLQKQHEKAEWVQCLLAKEQDACSHPPEKQTYEAYVLFGKKFEGWAVVTCGVCTSRRVDTHAGEKGHCPHNGTTHPVVSGDLVYAVCDICNGDVVR